jgi:hypothetical protein
MKDHFEEQEIIDFAKKNWLPAETCCLSVLGRWGARVDSSSSIVLVLVIEFWLVTHPFGPFCVTLPSKGFEDEND